MNSFVVVVNLFCLLLDWFTDCHGIPRNGDNAEISSNSAWSLRSQWCILGRGRYKKDGRQRISAGTASACFDCRNKIHGWNIRVQSWWGLGSIHDIFVIYVYHVCMFVVVCMFVFDIFLALLWFCLKGAKLAVAECVVFFSIIIERTFFIFVGSVRWNHFSNNSIQKITLQYEI